MLTAVGLHGQRGQHRREQRLGGLRHRGAQRRLASGLLCRAPAGGALAAHQHAHRRVGRPRQCVRRAAAAPAHGRPRRCGRGRQHGVVRSQQPARGLLCAERGAAAGSRGCDRQQGAEAAPGDGRMGRAALVQGRGRIRERLRSGARRCEAAAAAGPPRAMVRPRAAPLGAGAAARRTASRGASRSMSSSAPMSTAGRSGAAAQRAAEAAASRRTPASGCSRQASSRRAAAGAACTPGCCANCARSQVSAAPQMRPRRTAGGTCWARGRAHAAAPPPPAPPPAARPPRPAWRARPAPAARSQAAARPPTRARAPALRGRRRRRRPRTPPQAAPAARPCAAPAWRARP